MMSNTLKIGDKVFWRGGFGSDPVRMATIAGIEITRGGKYGDAVDEVPWSEVYDRNVTVDVDTDDGYHWAYAEQIKRIR